MPDSVSLYPTIQVCVKDQTFVLSDSYNEMILTKESDMYLDDCTTLTDQLHARNQSEFSLTNSDAEYKYCNELLRGLCCQRFCIFDAGQSRWLCIEDDEVAWTDNPFDDVIALFEFERDAEELFPDSEGEVESYVIQKRYLRR